MINTVYIKKTSLRIYSTLKYFSFEISINRLLLLILNIFLIREKKKLNKLSFLPYYQCFYKFKQNIT